MNNTIEVAIVMDITGSMQQWIDSACETVLESFATLQAEQPDATFRLGCVCYRDFGDRVPFVVSPFTNDLQLVQTTLKGARASGGDDNAEDIAGALEKVLELEWSNDKDDNKDDNNDNTTKLVLWVADAPAHGIKYHIATVSDRFPNGDPQKREPFNQVKEMAQRGIDFTMFRINNSIDKMVEEFSNAYHEVKQNAVPGEFDATFTLLDITKQDSDVSEPDVSDHLTSGYIDLTSYASYASSSSYASSDTYASSPSSSVFRTATETAVRSAISKRSVPKTS